MKVRRPTLDPKDHDPADRKEFTEAVRQILLKPMKPKPIENRNIPKKELEKGWKLERRKPSP